MRVAHPERVRPRLRAGFLDTARPFHDEIAHLGMFLCLREHVVKEAF